MSIASSSCRIDWRPSGQLCGALLALGVLAGMSAWLSDLPLVARGLLALASPAYGAWLAWREWRRPPQVLEFDRESLQVDAFLNRTEIFRVRLRGPLASLDARDAEGRRGTWLWSADTLPDASRRQLRLRCAGQSAQ